MSTKTILITGASGFIGRALTERLLLDLSNTKIILLSGLAIALFSFTIVTNKQEKTSKTFAKKSTSSESRVGNGLAMEDRNQFK